MDKKRKIKSLIVFLIFATGTFWVPSLLDQIVEMTNPESASWWMTQGAREKILKQNGDNAWLALRNYIQAQEYFKKYNLSSVLGNNQFASDYAYCENYRNLYYGCDKKGNQLKLISKEMADAYAGPPLGHELLTNSNTSGTPFKGYHFVERYHDDGLMNNITLMAFPADFPNTGRFVLWVNSQGKIKTFCAMNTERSKAEFYNSPSN